MTGPETSLYEFMADLNNFFLTRNHRYIHIKISYGSVPISELICAHISTELLLATHLTQC